MNFGVPASAITNSVWANATRTLTSLGAGTITFTSANNSSVANGASANFNLSPLLSLDITIAMKGAANVTWNSGMTDGTTPNIGATAAAAAAMQQTMAGNATIFPFISNTGTVSGNYSMGGMIWHQ